MPQSRRYGPADQLPGTLRRSCRQAQETFTAALSDAILAYGEGDKALRAAYAALKRKFEKRGDTWIAKHEPSGLRRAGQDSGDTATAGRAHQPRRADRFPADSSPVLRVPVSLQAAVALVS